MSCPQQCFEIRISFYAFLCSMATIQETHKVGDLVRTKSEGNNRESVDLKVTGKLPISSEHTNTKPANKEAVISEQTETETVSDLPLSEKASMKLVSEEQMGSVPAVTEPMGTEQMALDSELDYEQPASIKMPSPNPDASKALAKQSDSSDLLNSQPINADTHPNVATARATEESQEVVYKKTANVKALGAEQVSSEHADQQQISSVLVHSEDFNSQQVNAEGEPMIVVVELPKQQQPSSELRYSQLDGLELIAPQLVSSEHVHSKSVLVSEAGSSQHIITDFVNSQSLDHKTQSGTYCMETLHEKNVLVKIEHVYTEDVVSDLDQQLQVSSELMDQLQVSSEPVHMQTIGSEIVHSHPVNSDLVHSEPFGSEFDNSQPICSDIANKQLVTTDMVNYDPVDPAIQPNKRRKKKSMVWEHFTIENVGDGCRRACCKLCKQSFAYSTGSKVAGTSHLKRHIAKGTCAVMLRQQGNNQLTPYMPKTKRAGADTAAPGTTDPPKQRYRSSSSPYLIFDQQHCRNEIARMIIMHEYPLNMVEHPGFVAFVRNLQLRFDMVNFNAVQEDCVATYLREKQKLQEFMDKMPGRVCLTLDMWTSCQTTGYFFLHGQFVDHDWKLRRWLLNIVMEPFPESDTALSHAVATCLSYWNLDSKLCSITFNQPVSEAARENMRGLLSFKNQLILNGQLLVGRCVARTLSGMAQDALAAGQETVSKIRSSVKHVKTSDGGEDRFLELKQQLQVPSEKSLTLDNITKWNTTYHMLFAASELKEVFSCMDTADPEYKDAPTMEDWKRVDKICAYLKLFLEMANLLLAEAPPSTNLFFHEVWKIQQELHRDAASDDPFVRNVAKTLQEKFLEYWKETFLVLSIAVVMDPRFKMKLVEYIFTKLFGEEAPAYIGMVDDGTHQLFHEYVALPLILAPTHEVDVKGEENQQGSLISSNGLSDFEKYIMETSSQHTKSELDQYLEESLLPRVQELDVLDWWKLNKLKYPTLSKMACDILSIPLSSVGPDYVFDTVGKEMDQYRGSLRPETVEALMCAKDWLQHGHLDLS